MFAKCYPKIEKFNEGPLLNDKYQDKLDQLFARSVATGEVVYIPSAMLPSPSCDTNEDMMNSNIRFASLLQGGRNSMNCEGSSSIGQETLMGNTPIRNTATSIPTKEKNTKKLTAATRVEKGLNRVAIAYEKENEILQSHREDMHARLEAYSINKCVQLLNETTIEYDSKQWNFAYEQFAKLSTRKLFVDLLDGENRKRWITREFDRLNLWKV